MDEPLTDLPEFKRIFASIPITTFEPGETVCAAGTLADKLFFHRRGRLEIVIDGIRVAIAEEPGFIFPKTRFLYGFPHDSDVRALERAEFQVASAASLSAEDYAELRKLIGP
jgi:hypothetical protein